MTSSFLPFALPDITEALTPAAFGVLRRRGRKNPAGWILSANAFDSNR